MFINGDEKVGEAQVYNTVRELELEKENKKLREALSELANTVRDYGAEQESLVMMMAFEKAMKVLEE